MKVEYSKDLKTAYFDGVKFRRDAKTGYYLATKPTYKGRRERLHCYVWRFFNGPVPEGFHIHHTDENKNHNDIENLACVPKHEHTSYHAQKYVSENREKAIETMNYARIYASMWHGSEEGRKWHSEHAKEVAKNLKPIKKICQFCGKEYEVLPIGKSKFCSNNCKTADRRKRGVDNEKRICLVCGKIFECNKYYTTKTCSRECGSILHSHSRNQKERVGTGV